VDFLTIYASIMADDDSSNSDVTGAVHPVSDSEAAERLMTEYESQMKGVKERAGVWKRHCADYAQLKQTLASISDRVTHSSTMIPMGKKAYMEGTLVHTNEIMVLLGDNWFAERSAVQAGEICQRRIDKCTQMLEELDKELTLIESWKKQASGIGGDGTGGEGGVGDQGEVDIREPFDEKAETEWAEQHRRRVKDYKQQKSRRKEDEENQDDDDALFRRLDELEIEEELDEHLRRESEKKAAIKAVTEAKVTPERSGTLNKGQETTSHHIDPSQNGKEEMNAKVSFGRESNSDHQPSSNQAMHMEEVEEEEDESGSSEDWSESPPLSDEDEDDEDGEDVTASDAEIDAAIEAAEEAARIASEEAKYNTVPDRSGSGGCVFPPGNARRISRFSVSEIISENCEILDVSGEKQEDDEDSNSMLRNEHKSQLKPRQRRVSFGSISERLFMKDEEKRLQPLKATKNVVSLDSVAMVAASTEDAEAAAPALTKDVPTIFFTHHDYSSSSRPIEIIDNSQNRVPRDPSDLTRLYGIGGSNSPTRLKSILKPSGSSHSLSSFDESSLASSPSNRLRSSSSLSSSLGRFAVSPTHHSVPVTSQAMTSSSERKSSRFTVSPSSSSGVHGAMGAQHDAAKMTPNEAPHQQQPTPLLQHPVKDMVVESRGTAAAGIEPQSSNNQDQLPTPSTHQQQQQQQPTSTRKQSRFKLSRVQL